MLITYENLGLLQEAASVALQSNLKQSRGQEDRCWKH